MKPGIARSGNDFDVNKSHAFQQMAESRWMKKPLVVLDGEIQYLGAIRHFPVKYAARCHNTETCRQGLIRIVVVLEDMAECDQSEMIIGIEVVVNGSPIDIDSVFTSGVLDCPARLLYSLSLHIKQLQNPDHIANPASHIQGAAVRRLEFPGLDAPEEENTAKQHWEKIFPGPLFAHIT